MNTSKEKNLKDASVATRANYETAVNAAKAINAVSESAWDAAKAIDAIAAIHEDWCTADYEKAAEAAKAIDAVRESAWDAVREALCAADSARAAYNDYMAD